MSRRRRKRINYVATPSDERVADSSSNNMEEDELSPETDEPTINQVDILPLTLDTNEEPQQEDGELEEEDEEVDQGCLYHFLLEHIKQAIQESGKIQAILLTLVVVPFLSTAVRSLMSGDGVTSVLKTIFLQLVWLIALIIIFMICAFFYLSRFQVSNWTVNQLNESIAININDSYSHHTTRLNKSTQSTEKGGVAEISVIKKEFESKLKCARRDYLKLKREFAQRLTRLKEGSRERGEFLTRLQLKFPTLEKERDILIAEKEAIEKQHEEEKRRNRELITRFQRLQQQLGRSGQQRQLSNPY